ncbi:hypothetical protein ACWD48_30950 [Streptomyces sp. NPDC002519]
MTHPVFTTKECEWLDEALGALAATFGESLSDEDETALQELSFKVWRLGPERSERAGQDA